MCIRDRVTLLRHDPDRQLRNRNQMDTTGWVLGRHCMKASNMSRYGPLSDDALRVIAELDNVKKTRFLVAWGNDGQLYLRAAQAHSRGVAAV
eukprot:2149228-Alexandrium_andersonii.AAC.1